MAIDIIKALTQCELFGDLTEREIAPVAELCVIKLYEAGDVVFSQGDLGSTIYIIHDGQVTLERTVDLGERKATVAVATLGRGRAFGSWSSILGEPHHVMSSAVCNKATRVISVKGKSMRKALQENQPVGCKVLEKLALLLAGRLRGLYGAMEKL